MSLSIDFYIRLFVRVNTGALEVKRLARCVLAMSATVLAKYFPAKQQTITFVLFASRHTSSHSEKW